MCQDTGTITYFIEVGKDFPLILELGDIIREAVAEATKKIPLRPNTVNPWTHENPGNNTGRFIPWINLEFTDGDTALIHVLPKGGGSENTSRQWMISPGLGIRGIKEVIVKTVYEAGGKPCPPIIVGVGVGGGADISLKLAKKALLRPINIRNEDPKIAEIENDLMEKLNKLNIGPMGLGGSTTVLGVNIEWAYRHPASLPVGVITQCWAARKASIKVYPDGKIDVLSHDISLEDIII